ncbi:MAG: helix-hairpin-helix domain-containing protein, partial [Caldimonas sp.]
MIKKLLAVLLALFAAAAFAAVDANKATQAELESIKGIGPAISTKIIDERKKGSFKDWNDMVTRVKGVGEHNAAKFSTDGLTVNGAGFSGAPAATKPAAKSAMKADTKAPAAADTVKAPKTAKAEKAAAKSETTAAAPTAATPAADTKTAAATTATDAKHKKAEERAAAKEAKAKEKADKKAA